MAEMRLAGIFRLQSILIRGIVLGPLVLPERSLDSPRKHVVWCIPLVVTIALSLFSNFCIKATGVASGANRASVTFLEQQFDASIAKGKMTEEQKDEQIREMKARFDAEEKTNSPAQYFFILLVTLLSFAAIALLLFGSTRIMHDIGISLYDVLVVCGMSYYVISMKTVVLLTWSLISGGYVPNCSVAFFTGHNVMTLQGFIESRIDVFTLCFILVAGIGLGRLSMKAGLFTYPALLFALWAAGNFLLYVAAQYVEILRYGIVV